MALRPEKTTLVYVSRSNVTARGQSDNPYMQYTEYDRPVHYAFTQEQFSSFLPRRSSAPKPYKDSAYNVRYLKAQPCFLVQYRPKVLANVVTEVRYYPTSFDPLSMDQKEALQELALRFEKRCKEGSAQVGLMLAERKQTAKLVVTTARRLVSVVRRLKRLDFLGAYEELGVAPTDSVSEAARNFTKASSAYERGRRYAPNSKGKRGARRALDADPVTKTFSSLWLELQYGWKPLLMDVHESAMLLSDKVATKDAFKVSVRVSRTRRDEILGDDRKTIIGVGINKLWMRTSGCYRVKPEDAIIVAANAAGLLNPLSIAWELVPFSFVFDWFLPVGQFIDSFTTLSGFTQVSGFTVAKNESRLNIGGTVPRNDVAPGAMDVYETARFVKTETQRVLNTPPRADLQMKNPFSPLHVANALALVSPLAFTKPTHRR